MDRQEVWEHTVQAVRDHFTSGEFELGEFRVESNDAMRTISVIEVATSQSFGLLDVSFAYFTGDGVEGDPILVHLPPVETRNPLH